MSETIDFTIDIMIDLETLGTGPGSAILSIGAVAFDLDGEGAKDRGFGLAGPSGTFYRNIAIGKNNGIADDGAFRWWLGQATEARERLCAAPVDPLGVTLRDFSYWLRSWGQGTDASTRNPVEWDRYRIWSHGENFDIPLLEAGYFRIGSDKAPWRYNATRDTRTLFHALGIRWDAWFEEENQGTAHDALADALTQVRMVQRAWKLRP